MVLHFFDFIIVELLLLLRGNHFVLPTRIGMHTFDLLGIYSTQLTFLTPSRPTGTSGQKSPATRRPSSLRCGFHPISSDSLWHRLFLAAPSPLDFPSHASPGRHRAPRPYQASFGLFRCPSPSASAQSSASLPQRPSLITRSIQHSPRTLTRSAGGILIPPQNKS